MDNPRIIQGKLKGRKLMVPKDGTRPFTDRVKKTLFDILQGQLSQKIVLDPFAGTGSLGIEAISPDASQVVFVDSSTDAIKVIAENIKTLGIEHYARVVKADYKKFIAVNKEAFDFIFVDPPFKLIKKVNFDDFLPLMHQDSVLISKSNKELDNISPMFEVLDSRKIGVNLLYFLKKKHV